LGAFSVPARYAYAFVIRNSDLIYKAIPALLAI